MKFKFECGCEYTVEEIRAGKVKINGAFACPKHRVFVEHVVFTCSKCGKQATSNSTQSEVCKKCKLPKKKHPAKNYGVAAGPKQPPRRIDCAHLIGKCLAPPRGALFLNAKACVGCTKYQALDRSDEILEYARAGDSFTELSI